MVNDEDYDTLNKWKWYPFKSNHSVYAARMDYSLIKPRMILMHRQILNLTNPKIFADHIDPDGLNNQRENLRECNNSQNSMNSRKTKNAKCRYIGVHINRSGNRNYIRGQIMFNRKHINLGNFKTEEDAAIAYNIKAKELFGEFANLNIIK